jgi:hypothetical protein
MIALSRKRPRSITVFAIAFFAAALMACIDGLLSLALDLAFLQTRFPAFAWSRDALIVWHSAWLSIALIPIAMIWLSAVRFARWLVTVMALVKCVALLFVAPDLPRLVFVQPLWLPAQLLGLGAVIMLFTPASHRWFARKEEADPAVFE